VAEAIARQCFARARAGVFNRDHKPSNLVVTGATPGGARVAVLDTVAVRRLGRPAGLTTVPLERLVLEAIGVGAAPRRTLVARFVREWVSGMATGTPAERRRARREVWRVFAARIAAHGDPTPIDNPCRPVSVGAGAASPPVGGAR
jgi:hypothetical protein